MHRDTACRGTLARTSSDTKTSSPVYKLMRNSLERLAVFAFFCSTMLIAATLRGAQNDLQFAAQECERGCLRISCRCATVQCRCYGDLGLCFHVVTQYSSYHLIGCMPELGFVPRARGTVEFSSRIPCLAEITNQKRWTLSGSTTGLTESVFLLTNGKRHIALHHEQKSDLSVLL